MALCGAWAEVAAVVRDDVRVLRVPEHVDLDHDVIQVLPGLQDDDLERRNGPGGNDSGLIAKKKKKFWKI